MTPYDNAHEEEKLNSDKGTLPAKPSRAEAEAAVETLLKWAGDDPSREGLMDTPARVARAYEEFFSGYEDNPEEMLARTFIGRQVEVCRVSAPQARCDLGVDATEHGGEPVAYATPVFAPGARLALSARAEDLDGNPITC